MSARGARGVSPTIGVLLMVVATVVISAVIPPLLSGEVQWAREQLIENGGEA